jgi:hypothetical protein
VPSHRKANQRRNLVHFAGRDKHLYARVDNRSRPCVFCTKLAKAKVIDKTAIKSTTHGRCRRRKDAAGLHVCADCWDTKGFHAWHDYGEKPAKELTAAMKSREQFADELQSEDSDNGSDSGDELSGIESLHEDSE